MIYKRIFECLLYIRYLNKLDLGLSSWQIYNLYLINGIIGCFSTQCELYHWIEVLDRFDSILERVAKPDVSAPNETMIYLCRRLEDKQVLNSYNDLEKSWIKF